MPVIIKLSDEKAWLDPDLNTEAAKSLLKPFSDHEMTFYPVDRLINDVKNDLSEMILPIK